MIAIFTTKEDAKKYSDACYKWLHGNCPRFNATSWQEPVSNKTVDLWYVQIPQEMDRDFYPTPVKISVATMTEYAKRTALQEKPDDSFRLDAKEINIDLPS